jgi:hypothetical protein
MSTPTDLPDYVAADDGTLVAVPSQATRHLDQYDVAVLAMDRVMATADSSLARLNSAESAVLDAARAAVEHLDRAGHWDLCDLDALAAAVRRMGGAR